MSLNSAKGSAYSAAEGRRFGLLVGSTLLALALITVWRGRSTLLAESLGAVGALLLLAGASAPVQLRPVYRAWMARVLSSVTTPLFMGIMYFVVITPVALVRRALRGNPLTARVGPDGYWVVRESGKHSDMLRQF